MHKKKMGTKTTSNVVVLQQRRGEKSLFFCAGGLIFVYSIVTIFRNMKINYFGLWMTVVFVICAYLSTHVPVEQHLSDMTLMALTMIFIFGFGTIASLGAPTLRNQSSLLSVRSAKVFSVLNFICLLIIFGTAGWLVGGLFAFNSTNFLAFSVLLYFLGIRLGAYLHFHV